MLRSMLVAALVVGGCSKSPSADFAAQAAFYGDDDLLEFYEATPALKDSSRATAMLVANDAYVVRAGQLHFPDAVTIEDYIGACTDVPFASQLTPGECSGTLIAPDLFLTAGHCVATQAECEATSILFDYALSAAGEQPHPSTSSLYACRELVVQKNEWVPLRDYAVLRLDRAVADRAPRAMARRVPAKGEPVTLIGYPLGAALKIDPAGSALGLSQDGSSFLAAIDAFEGNSGSGLLDSRGQLVGILSYGADDFVREGACSNVNRIALPCTRCGESIMPAAGILDALCESAPEEALCAAQPTASDAGTEATVGDGGFPDRGDAAPGATDGGTLATMPNDVSTGAGCSCTVRGESEGSRTLWTSVLFISIAFLRVRHRRRQS
jgi:Trypsin-like peptidase domain